MSFSTEHVFDTQQALSMPVNQELAPEKPATVYSYAEGMQLTDTKFTDEGVEYSTIYVDPELFKIDDNNPDTAAHLARVNEAIDNPTIHQVKLENGRSVNVESMKLNGEVETQKALVMFLGWGGSGQNPVGRRESGAIAAAFPDTHVYIVNFPGSEGSSNLPRQMAREIARTGSFLPVAEILSPVLDEIFDEYKEKRVLGASLGARAATAAVSGLKKKINAMRIIEPVGTRDLSLREIAEAFLVREPAHAAQVVANSPDINSREIQIKNDSKLNVVKAMFKAFKRRSLYTLMVRLPKAMARDNFEFDLRAAEGNISQELTIISAEHSELTDPFKIHRMLGNVAARAAMNGSGPQDITHRVMEGRTHSYLNGVPFAQALTLAAKFEKAELPELEPELDEEPAVEN